MKILWFTNTPSLYKKEEGGYNGGGWISSLERAISLDPAIEELGIVFLDTDKNDNIKKGNVSYFPISMKYSFSQKLKRHLFRKEDDAKLICQLLDVIHVFRPDVIHIFGTERCFGLIKKYTDIPVVIHLQGILNPYLNAFFVPYVGLFEYLRYMSIREIYSKIQIFSFFKKGAERERKILSLCQNYMGRTEWDESVTRLLGEKNLNYYYCSEVLRPVFYNSKPWAKIRTDKLKIITTISLVEYKGFDLVLKTAKLLKEFANFDFEWNVVGIKEYSFWERKLKINTSDVNVYLNGVVDENTLVDFLLNSDIFVHPSYIDNSPNSLCEAQILGMPVIATNIGGISSLINNNETGFLVPANDPYFLASKIIELAEDNLRAANLGAKARIEALNRHDVKKIVQRNIEIYKLIQI